MQESSINFIETHNDGEALEIYSIHSIDSEKSNESKGLEQNGDLRKDNQIGAGGESSLIIIENNSLEIDVPFFEDDANKRNSSQEGKQTTRGKTQLIESRTILDKILSSDSISSANDSSLANFYGNDNKITSLVNRWRSTKEPSLSQNKQHPEEIANSSTKNSQNILKTFPISSPIQHSQGDSQDNQSVNEFVENISPNKKQLFVPLDTTSIEDIHDLEFSKILNTSTSNAVLSTPLKVSNKDTIIKFPAANVDLITGPQKENLNQTIKRKSLENNYDQLKYYISRGKEYDPDDSKFLISKHMRENKKAFKEVNQNYRDNIDARSTLIVEMSSNLIRLLSSKMDNFSDHIKPSTLQSSSNDNNELIRFLRRSNSEYDFRNDVYYPADFKIVEENIYLLYYDAFEFFKQYSHNKSALFHQIKEYTKAGKHVLLTLYNLKNLKKAIQTVENNDYITKVQNQLTGSPSKQNKRKRMKVIEDLHMSSTSIEKRLRYIDRLWGVKVHTVNSHLEFINSLPNLLSLVGKQYNDSAIKYMKYAYLHVKSAKNKEDVLTKIIHQVGRVPELKAENITRAYPTFQQLLKDFDGGKLRSGSDGKYLMTEKIESRLYKLFTSDDPNETI
ncbi:hypothetical protein TPHA_0M01520 [Tetrapisispora phaffii CBS 4417]|uniref:ERCC4 domain-containing protein n=1 Tax=Tetrapisispora phaffii (strain ATCC 24235 / CBS 4417 / NBRC 1672 / NRRL Y-8282 / UCD 70-5) TaxID=1071381 RepID=G8C0L2_TETPH|nr:hypothetical protein TPHA_0M01520 [Tetrapisispora phaffii CBS 4417]CCE65727.1 hypothetical protein TPHA_0M01520 [Tetrapisispora phaffii CBS 4417]